MKAQRLEVPIQGMDCHECCQHVQRALAALPGVQGVEVLLAAEKAVVELDPDQVDLAAIRQAVARAGYRVPAGPEGVGTSATEKPTAGLPRAVLFYTGLVFGAVLLVVVAGEWLGLLDAVTERVPFTLGVALVLVGWYPVLRNVLRAAWRGQVISHTLMSVGVVAALLVGEWVTAAIVVFFMRVGDGVERFTAERARRAVRELTALAPRRARVERNGALQEVPAEEVQVGDVVVVRPGEQIPVDGEVIDGQATVNQATITGEAMPVEAGPGTPVFAATLVELGRLRIRTTRVGPDTTFGRVIRLVEEAEANRADVQRLADRFSGYFLPVVALIALLTWLLRRDPLATAAVLVVACSCSFALATPIAMLAAIGAGARRGILIKGGKYLELLARADVLLIDKTGTLTLGRPQLTDVIPLDGRPAAEVLALAAAAERDSEHPLAEAVRQAAQAWGVPAYPAQDFAAMPGLGIQARVNGHQIQVGSRRFVAAPADGAAALETQGKTLLYVAEDGRPIGILAASDTPRPEVAEAVERLRGLGLREIRLLTGDNRFSAAALAETLGLTYQAELLPEDKVAVVKEYQAQGHTVVMVGDGVNDAPALAQADVGIAMGAAGTDIAMEAAHVVLMRDDWRLVPAVFRLARRTVGVVKMNFGFTALYNLVGLSLAALGFLPPALAAAAQSLPDLGILANSSRLLRAREES
ncbi:MAG: copper-translocating P-type ATPase [Litorilinea sp.]|nr:MAG: copper-translocating P-type ATPase [Litorilinea sp.]